MSTEVYDLNTPPLVPSRETVLIVDEAGAPLHCYTSILRSIGYQVRYCGTHEEGEKLVSDAVYGLVIVAQGTSNFEGRPVVESAVARNHLRPVLVIARSMDTRCYLDAIASGATDYLAAPISALELAGAVQTHLWVSPSASRHFH